MRTIILFLNMFVFQLALSQQSELIGNRITVNGSVELKQIADQASIVFTVKGVGESLRAAVGDADKKTSEVVERLKSIGLKPQNISTSQFYSGENYDDKAFLSSSRDFKAEIKTLIKIDSLAFLQPVLFTISEMGIENLSDIAFSLKDELGFRRKARFDAALKAREKAEDMAKALGVTVGQVLAIEESQPTQTSTNQPMYLRSSARPNPFNPAYNVVTLGGNIVDETKGTGFFAQTISITSQVVVTFQLK